MTEQPKWKLFEKDIHAIHSLFQAPGSTITHDELILGADSNTERQVDVLIRTTVETYPILIAIECKNKKRPIDVAEVGEFSVLAKDVRANKGVMISTSGFTAAAISLSKTYGLDLLKFDQKESELFGLRSIPILCIQNAASWFAELRLLSHSELSKQAIPSHNMELFSESGELQGTLAQFVALSGREGKILNEPGETVLSSTHNLFIKLDNKLVKADVRARIRIDRRFFFHLSPIEEVIMSDVSSGAPVRRFLRSGFVHLRPWEEGGKAAGWNEIQSDKELSVEPVYTITNNPSWT